MEDRPVGYQLLADLIAGLHLLWVAVVVFGLLLFLIGGALGWEWTRNRWVRGIHCAMILGVVVRTLFANECPATTWEQELRIAAGQYYVNEEGERIVNYAGSPVGKFCHDLIHPPLEWAPIWVYPIIYAAFAALVLATFWLVPVRWRPAVEPAACTPPSCCSP
jgi:hypothetical protein